MHRISRAKIVITLSDINRVITKKRKKENDSVALYREKMSGTAIASTRKIHLNTGKDTITSVTQTPLIKNLSAPLCSTFLKKEIHPNYGECGWGIEDHFKKDICHLLSVYLFP